MNSKPLSEAKEKRGGEGVIGANSSPNPSNHARSTPGPPSLQTSGWEPRLSGPLGGCEAVACCCDPRWTLSPLPSTQTQDKTSCFQHHHVRPPPRERGSCLMYPTHQASGSPLPGRMSEVQGICLGLPTVRWWQSWAWTLCRLLTATQTLCWMAAICPHTATLLTLKTAPRLRSLLLHTLNGS